MSDSRDYKLDVSGLKGQEKSSPSDRPYISVLFACCSVYLRIYRSADGKEYAGRCPRCLRPIKFTVGPGGTNERSFVVS
ncbi:MAG TPA: hypothetical protein VL992_11335 [Tepidisphaeraceae bacterium]|nr:hypothetical protein [Tepidisphaeraceae bacterium]